MEVGDWPTTVSHGTVQGGGCRGVDRDILHLQIFIKTTIAMHGSGSAARLVEYLPSAHKALGSIPSTV